MKQSMLALCLIFAATIPASARQSGPGALLEAKAEEGFLCSAAATGNWKTSPDCSPFFVFRYWIVVDAIIYRLAPVGPDSSLAGVKEGGAIFVTFSGNSDILYVRVGKKVSQFRIVGTAFRNEEGITLPRGYEDAKPAKP